MHLSRADPSACIPMAGLSLGSFYQEKQAQPACQACPHNTQQYVGVESGANKTACLCKERTYNSKGIAGEACAACPVGASCSGKLDAPVPLPGYVRGTGEGASAAIVKCQTEEACLGGPQSLCAEGYTGLRCGECADGWYMFGRQCEKCGSDGVVAFLNVLLLVLLFVVVTFFVGLTVLNPQKGSPLIFLMRSLETLGILGLTAVEWPSSVQTFLSIVSLVNFNTELFQIECSLGRTHPVRQAAMAPLFLLVVYGIGLLLWALVILAKKSITIDSAQDSWTTMCKTMHPVEGTSPQRERSSGKFGGKRFVMTLGLKWKNIGASPPDNGGIELSNSKLAFELNHTTTFTNEDLAAFGVQGLLPQSYIKSGNSYFTPVATDQTAPSSSWRSSQPVLALVTMTFKQYQAVLAAAVLKICIAAYPAWCKIFVGLLQVSPRLLKRVLSECVR